jgi:hypothetical protein
MLSKALRFSVVLLILISTAHAANSWPAIKPLVNTLQIEEISRARFKALVARDDTAFAKYYMPGFQMTTAWGTVEDLTFLERWIKTAPPGFTLKPINYHVTVSADEEMAYATFQVDEVYPDASGGSPTNITSQYTEIYVFHHNAWMLAEAHFSYQSKPAT